MESSPKPSPASAARESGAGRPGTRVRRFGIHEIVFHWTVVLPYLTLGASGIVLLLEKNLGREWVARDFLVTLHETAGVALITVPLLVLAVSPPEPFFGNLRECLRWRISDLWWLHASALRVFFPRVRLPRAGRFNAGQKLNLLHVALIVPIIAATGVALWIAGASQLAVRLVHAGAAGLSLVLAAGHMYLALIHPTTRKALGSMFHGYVDATYAAHHHPAWLDSVTGVAVPEDPARASKRRSYAVTVLLCLLMIPVFSGAAVEDPPAPAPAGMPDLLKRYVEEPATLVSPGALHALHAAEPDLARCTSCHDPLGTAAAERCLKCHEEIAARIEQATGYHGTLGRDCGSCHADHRPRIIDLDDRAFQHDLAVFTLEGAHRRLECGSCHDRDGDGRRTYLKIEHATCGDCHEDPHSPSFEKACSHCHEEHGWDEPAASFAHELDTSFALSGAHERAACSRCHRPAASDGALVLAGTPSECRACHEDPHGPADPAREGNPAGDCSVCHDSTSAWRSLRFDHDTATRLPLDARHRELPCSSCHSPADPLHFRELSADLRAAAPSYTCEGCHRDIERDLHGTFAGEPRDPAAMSPHVGEVSCAECHVVTPRPLTQSCSACHPADYDELFVEWQARVSIEVIRSSAIERRHLWLRAGIHNWQGTVETLREARGAKE